MERFVCLDCRCIGPLNIRGNCGTCGSVAVVSEHAHGYEPFPGYYVWMQEAERILNGYELKKIERHEVSELERMYRIQ